MEKQACGSGVVAVPLKIDDRARTGGSQETPTIRSASRFGVWRARAMLRLAVRLGRFAMTPLAPANPARVTVLSVLAAFDERTRDLPGNGFLTLDENAPALYVREATWLLVMVTLVVYAVLLCVGIHPIVALVHDLT